MKKVQNSIHTLIKESGFPSFVLAPQPFSYRCEIAPTKLVLFAKLIESDADNVLGAIWGSYYEWAFHFTGTDISAGFSAPLFANMHKTHFLNRLRAVFSAFACFAHFLSCFIRGFCSCSGGTYLRSVLIAKRPTDLGATHFLKSFSAMFFALARFAILASCFLTLLFAKLGLSQLLTCFRGHCTPQCRASNTSNIKALFAKGLELVKPVLLTLNQEWDENQFQNLEDESVFTMLIPSSLQMGIVMFIASKIPEVLVTSVVQVDCAANVELSSDSTRNAVNTRSLGKGLLNRVQWGHGEKSPYRLISLEVIGVATACGLDSLDLYYTPSTTKTQPYPPMPRKAVA